MRCFHRQNLICFFKDIRERVRVNSSCQCIFTVWWFLVFRSWQELCTRFQFVFCSILFDNLTYKDCLDSDIHSSNNNCFDNSTLTIPNTISDWFNFGDMIFERVDKLVLIKKLFSTVFVSDETIYLASLNLFNFFVHWFLWFIISFIFRFVYEWWNQTLDKTFFVCFLDWWLLLAFFKFIFLGIFIHDNITIDCTFSDNWQWTANNPSG